jgi:catechol 2,3-dioxygenase-like lactoylglutathione lyase family enzyme
VIPEASVYEALRSRGAVFLTPPYNWGAEIRCFLRDPDGHLVEISQSATPQAVTSAGTFQ